MTSLSDFTNFKSEQISHIAQVFPLLTLNKKIEAAAKMHESNLDLVFIATNALEESGSKWVMYC